MMLNLENRRENLDFVKNKAVKSCSSVSWEQQTEQKTWGRDNKNT